MKPIFVGLGTAAVLAAGGASALADDAPSPSPSDSGSASPAPGRLDVGVYTKPANPDAGDPVDVTTTVEATGGAVAGVRIKGVRASADGVTLTGTCTAPFTSDACAAGDLASGEDAVFRWELKAPEKTKRVEVTVTVAAAELDDVVAPATVTFVLPSPSPTPTTPPPSPSPTKTPTKSPTKSPTPSKKPSKTPSPTDSSSGRGSGGGGSDGGASTGGSGAGSGGSTGSAGSAGSPGGVLPPQPNSSFDPRDPQVALPSIEAPNPSVAPGQGGVATTPQSRLQGNEAPVAQDLTFERMASTQVAWLAALLVAFSLLLTQLRLGRRRLPAGAAAKRVKVKGAHRRPRRGLFGK